MGLCCMRGLLEGLLRTERQGLLSVVKVTGQMFLSTCVWLGVVSARWLCVHFRTLEQRPPFGHIGCVCRMPTFLMPYDRYFQTILTDMEDLGC